MLNAISLITNYIVLISVPIGLIYRYRKNKNLVFFNPCFYLLLGSYLYLTVSSTFLQSYIAQSSVSYYATLSPESIQITSILCNWYTVVFALFYFLSADRNLITIKNFKPRKITYQFALILVGILFIVQVYYLLRYAPTFVFADRSEGLNLYARQILNGPFRLRVTLRVFSVALAILIWRTKNFYWLWLLIVPILTEFLSGGRTHSLQMIVFGYIIYLTLTGKARIKLISVSLISYVTVVPILRSYGQANLIATILDWEKFIFKGFSEIFATRLSTVIVYDQFSNYQDLQIYLRDSFLSLLPSFVRSFLYGQERLSEINYRSLLRDFYIICCDIDWGLAGNFVTEALFNGGIGFAIISPLVIGLFFYALNQSKIVKTFPGFMFLCLLISQMQYMLRTSFYDSILTLVYILLFYLPWLIWWEWGRFVFSTRVNRSYSDLQEQVMVKVSRN